MNSEEFLLSVIYFFNNVFMINILLIENYYFIFLMKKLFIKIIIYLNLKK